MEDLHPVMHNYYLNIIKKLLRASFVGWVTDKQGKYLKIVVNKNAMALPFEGGDIIGEESYKNLIREIIKSNGDEIQETAQLPEQERGAATVDA